MAVASRGELLYLEDLHVGRRFAGGSHALDAEQIKAFAGAFDPWQTSTVKLLVPRRPEAAAPGRST
jgi:hypothetical protein